MNAKWKWLESLPWLAILALAFVLALGKIEDPDIWWHLKCGQLLVHDHRILHQEIFSYTAQGRPWIDGYIAAQALFYLVYEAGGAAGITILGAILVTFTFALAIGMGMRGSCARVGAPLRGRQTGGSGRDLMLVAALPAVYMARGVMISRPALLTPIFVLVNIWIMEDFYRRRRCCRFLKPASLRRPSEAVSKGAGGGGRDDFRFPHPSRRPQKASSGMRKTKINTPVSMDNAFQWGDRIWWLIPLSALWANSHPAFFLGPIITFTYILGRLIQPDKSGKFEFRILLLPIMQILATLINPYGIRIYYSAVSLTSDLNLRNAVLEWKPLFDKYSELAGVIPAYILVVGLGLAAFIWGFRRARLEHFLLFVFFAASAALGRRNVLLFSPLSLPLIAWTISSAGVSESRLSPSLWKYRRASKQLIASLIFLIALFLIWFAGTNRLYFYTRMFRETGVGINTTMFPTGAAEVLLREKIKGRLFHNYSFGGYLLFQLWPQYEVFIDGRVYPYTMEIFGLMEDAIRSYKKFGEVRNRFDIRAVAVQTFNQDTRPMIEGFLASSEWAVVYADGAALVFLERGAGNDGVIARNEVNVFKTPPIFQKPDDSRHIFSRVKYPFAIMYWAMLYERLGRPDLAANILKPALSYRPGVPDLGTWFGSLLIQSGDYDEGKKHIQPALDRNPDDPVALTAMAGYYIGKKELDRAEEILMFLLAKQKAESGFWVSCGDVEMARKNYPAASKFYRKAIEYQPNNGNLWEKVGMSLIESNKSEARKAFNRALSLKQATYSSPEDIARIRRNLEVIRP